MLDVTVAPGEREPLHAHCRSSVMYLMQEGVYRDYDASRRTECHAMCRTVLRQPSIDFTIYLPSFKVNSDMTAGVSQTRLVLAPVRLNEIDTRNANEQSRF